MELAYITHPSFIKHEMLPHHPESPARLIAIMEAIQNHPIAKHLRYYTAPAATREQLLYAHSNDHIDNIFTNAPQEDFTIIDPDTAMNPYTLTAALHAVGALVKATDLVLTDRHQRVFCGVRLPGHHATRDQAMGFCFFNNVAVGACYALNQHDLNRIAIIDFDVHNGNGTINILRNESRILYCSSFQYPFYPMVGIETSNDHIINMPLAAGSGSELFRETYKTHCFPKLHAFKPEIIYISAGFDAHHADPLADLNLTEADYEWLTTELVGIAEQYSRGRIISTLEGGYNLNALSKSVILHLQALLNIALT